MANSDNEFKSIQKATKRVRELNNLTVDVTSRDELLQSYSQLLTITTGAKFSQVNIFDENTQYTIASHGAQFPPLPKSETFCTFTLDGEAALEMADMTKDDRVKNHAAVQGEQHIRFYYGTPLITSNKIAIGTVCIIHDGPLKITDKERDIMEIIAGQITRQLELKNELVASKKQLEQQQNTLQKVIHDLRTPISGIIGGLSMIDEDAINPEFKKTLKLAKTSGRNLIEYVENSLKKIIKSNRESGFINAATLKEKLISLYGLQAQNKNIELDIQPEIDPKERITTLSSGDLINITGNLVSNAIKFSSKDDTILVTIEYADSPYNQYKIVVSDPGTGMTHQQIENIYALKKHTPAEGTNKELGFGIGLTEALRTLINHEGTFKIDSGKNEGTAFTLLFPRKH